MEIPQTGLLRIHHILGRPAKGRRPATPPIIPVSRSTWWLGVKQGRFPQPVRTLGVKSPAWRAKDIRALVEKLSAQPAAPKKKRAA
jgi:predicted DNA-binding transcriptional regulator AlpA